MKNVILIGMPGAGKSTVGVVLAKHLGYTFLDSDLVIQQKYGKLLHELISEHGVEGFWKIENDVNAGLACDRTVIATGGSAIYGKEAMESNNEGKVSYAYEQVVLAIIVSTGIASIFLTAEHIIDYNTGLAHAIFYSLTSYPHIEKNHLHGEVVSYGVLNLLLVDGNEEDFEKVYEFSKSVGLPTKLKDLEFDSSQLEEIAKIAVEMKDIDHNPYKITKEMVEESIRKLEAM